MVAVMPQFQDGLVLPASVTDPAFPPVYSIGESVPLRVDNNGILQADVTGSIVAIIGNVTVDGEVTADAIAFNPRTAPTVVPASVNSLRSDLNGRLIVTEEQNDIYVGVLQTGAGTDPRVLFNGAGYIMSAVFTNAAATGYFFKSANSTAVPNPGVTPPALLNLYIPAQSTISVSFGPGAYFSAGLAIWETGTSFFTGDSTNAPAQRSMNFVLRGA